MDIEKQYIAGCDLGKLSDHTAFALFERTREKAPTPTVSLLPVEWKGPDKTWRYTLRRMDRWDVGTSYTDIATWLGKAYSRSVEEGGFGGSVLAIDKTGVGTAVLEMIQTAMASPKMDLVCLKCNGTGFIEIRPEVRGTILIIEPQNLTATVATLNQLPNVLVTEWWENASITGAKNVGGTFQAMLIERGGEFAEWACRKQGYANIVEVIGPREPYKIPCTFCKNGTIKGSKAKIRPITITGGSTANPDGAGWKVPKKELVSILQALMGTGRIKVKSSLPNCSSLLKEFENFKVNVKETGHEEFGEWRTGQHDDMVLACAIGLWVGERGIQRAWVN